MDNRKAEREEWSAHNAAEEGRSMARKEWERKKNWEMSRLKAEGKKEKEQE